jgi:hypothetical protein
MLVHGHVVAVKPGGRTLNFGTRQNASWIAIYCTKHGFHGYTCITGHLKKNLFPFL